MTKSAATKQPQSKAWFKPKLERLGTIADVANAQGAGPQGNGAKT